MTNVNNGDGTLAVIDAATNTVTTTIPVGSYPYGVAVNPKGTKVYVANGNSKTVSVIDAATNTVTATIPVGTFPYGVTVDPTGAKVYVTNMEDNTVSIIDTATNTVIATLPVISNPWAIAFNPEGTKLYVVSNNVTSIIDASTNTVISTVPVGGSRSGISFTPDGKKVYVVGNGTVSVIDAANNKVITTISNAGFSPVAFGQFIVPSALPVLPVANFSSNVTMGSTPLSVQFTDQSRNATEWNWDFGDGTNSTEQNPTHTYFTPGDYIVNLTVSNASGTNSTTDKIIVTVADEPIYNPENGHYYDKITVPGSITWDAAKAEAEQKTLDVNGVHYIGHLVTITSAEEQQFIDNNLYYLMGYWTGAYKPDHTYPDSNHTDGWQWVTGEPWVYTNWDTYINQPGNDSPLGEYVAVFWDLNLRGDYPQQLTTAGYVIEYEAKNPIANFTTNVTNGIAPLSIHFTDLSENATEWNWDFGDGTNSTEQNPTHTYSEAGTYTVNLTVSNAVGNNSLTKTSYIEVEAATSVKLTSITLDPENSSGTTTNAPGAWSTNLADPLAQMGVKNDEGVFLNQNFSGGSLGEISIPLKSGDNNFTLICSNMPGANYPGNEYYGAVLFFNGVSTPPQIAVYNSNGGTGNFSVQPAGTQIMGGANGGLFFDKAPGTSVYTTPDGTKIEVVSYIVNTSGNTDEVSWGKIGSDGNNDTIAKLTLRVMPPSIPIAAFSALPISGNAPLKIAFTDNSSRSPTSWNWDFGDGNTSTQQNPTHTYYAAGNYTVTLTVSNANGTDSTKSAINVKNIPPTGPYAYITNPANGTVSLIDTVTNNVIATVNVGINPLGVAVSYDKKRVFVTNVYSDTVSVIDTATNTVIATVNGFNEPWGVAISPDGERVYVANSGSDTVSIIDTATNTIAATVTVGTNPRGVAINPDGTMVYVTNQNSNDISVIDTATKNVTTIVGAGSQPWGVAVSPYEKKVYVANCGSSTVSVIDTATNTVSATLSVGSNPVGVAFVPNGTKAYVTNFGSNTASVISTATNTVKTTVGVGNTPYGVVVTPDGTKAYVVNMNDNTISVIDIATDTVTAKVPVEKPVAFGQFIVSSSAQQVLPVANFSSNVTIGKNPLSVQFKDLSENATKWSWDFGDGAHSTEQNPVHTYLAAGNYIVTLTVNNSAGSNTLTKNNYIVATNSGDNIIGGFAPFTVKFRDQSTNAASWQWNFGDGNTSTEQNPKHTYSNAGRYVVTLTVSNAAGSNTATKTSYINVISSLEPPVAAFSASTRLGNAPLNISFTDNSIGSPTSWNWDFGDGTTSMDENPVHIYSQEGQYYVTLAVSNDAGSNEVTKYSYITVVNSVEAPVAAFNATATA